jgi:hypothetical protein
MQGNKTHAQHLRTLERKPDLGEPTQEAQPSSREPREANRRGGTEMQESRDHNKHNHSGQTGHKPQSHGPAEEKH